MKRERREKLKSKGKNDSSSTQLKILRGAGLRRLRGDSKKAIPHKGRRKEAREKLLFQGDGLEKKHTRQSGVTHAEKTSSFGRGGGGQTLREEKLKLWHIGQRKGKGNRKDFSTGFTTGWGEDQAQVKKKGLNLISFLWGKKRNLNRGEVKMNLFKPFGTGKKEKVEPTGFHKEKKQKKKKPTRNKGKTRKKAAERKEKDKTVSPHLANAEWAGKTKESTWVNPTNVTHFEYLIRLTQTLSGEKSQKNGWIGGGGGTRTASD